MKNKYLYHGIIALALLCSNAAFAQTQNIEFEKKYFPNNKEGLKRAKEYLEIGIERYSNGTLSYKVAALPYLLYANDFNPNNAELNIMIGDCYLRSAKKEQALKHLEKAVLLSSPLRLQAYMLLGEAYHLNYEFDKAITTLNTCKQLLNAKNADELKRINKKIAECKTAKKMMENPVNVFIDNLGSVVNTSYSEYGPLINADASSLYFTSSRPGEAPPAGLGEIYNENIYVTHRKDGEWTAPIPVELGKPDKKALDVNEAAAGISLNGDMLFVFLGENGGDLGYTTLDGTTWMPKKTLGNAINSPAHEASASLSPDRRTLYFVSNRDNQQGNHQIYYSTKDLQGAWTPAQPIGAPIASGYDERAVFIHANGKTLYFSSNGHNTMGGYDIFRSDFEDGKWTTPVNLGYPINTPEDDLFFMLNASGRYAYFSSFREGGEGLYDLYRITFIGADKPTISASEDNLIAYIQKPQSEVLAEKKVQIANTTVTLLKGTVKDAKTNTPVYANIEITDNDLGIPIATFSSNSETGSYMVVLPSGKNYGLVVNAKNYLFYSENVNIRDHTEYQEIHKDILMNGIGSVGSKVVLNNIFFNSGSAQFSQTSIIELDRMVALLNEQPKLRIEVSGHTDNVGSAEFNYNLSMERAKSVVDYLIKAGIDADRLTYVGYGFDQPVASNATTEGRLANRRTEFKVLESK
ncbi:MAG: OmpA family protein [Prevotellaceae bacterium]|jgi:outer membrane protein OmpA-like peptidoglycan-associated protein/tetratricopeptide (TPR) repeat protein|nr:OmpA family protein [Prevotellaceae bacterium]